MLLFVVQIRGMHTLIRDALTTKHDFVFYSDRLIRLVVEHGLGHLPFTEKQVITPTGSVYTGVDFCKRLCGVSVIRSGESMENALRACCKGIKIGKILIHREGDNGQQVCRTLLGLLSSLSLSVSLPLCLSLSLSCVYMCVFTSTYVSADFNFTFTLNDTIFWWL